MDRRNPARLAASALIAASLAACTSPDGVRTESAAQIDATPATSTAPPDDDTISNTDTDTDTDSSAGTTLPDSAPATTASPGTSPPTSTDSLPAPSVDGLLFELPDLTVEVASRPTTADLPPGGYDGFMSAVQLDDGSFVASGFDARFDGGQPERSALWRSAGGAHWERVGEPVGARTDQQHIAALYVDDGQVHALETGLEVEYTSDGFPLIEFGLTGEWTSDDGTAWGSVSLVGNNVVNGVERIDGTFVAYGAAKPDTDGEFAASIVRPPQGGGDWADEEIRDASGATFPGSYIADMHTVGDTIIAVGATAHTDPISSSVGSLQDMVAVGGASDVAIWRSTDAGATWDFITTDTFSGKSGPAIATHLVELDGWLYLMAATVEAYQTTVVVHRSNDLGDTWERVKYDKALASGVGNSTELTNFGVYAVDGFLVVLEERFAFSQNMFMTVIDPETGDSVTHSITDELGVLQIEHILGIDGGALGFGRVERGRVASDLQLVDIRRVDPTDTGTSDSNVSAAETAAPLPAGGTEPVTVDSDTLGYRQARPRAATAVDSQWTIDTPGFVLSNAVATDDVIVYSMIETGNVHRVYGVDRASGAALWSVDRADQRVTSLQLVDGVIVVDWTVTEQAREAVAYDAATGAELWTASDLDGYFNAQPASSNHVVRSLLDDVFDLTLLDPQTGDVVGSYFPTGSSLAGRLNNSDGQLVELDAATLAPLGDPIPLGRQFNVWADVAVLDSRVVSLDGANIEVFDRRGTPVAQYPFYAFGNTDLVPVRPGSDLVAILADGEIAGFDASRLTIEWITEAELVRPVGDIGGEAHAVLQVGSSAELISLETGVRRCTIDGVRSPDLLRHGFFADGATYGFDCELLWTAPDGNATPIDLGILSSSKVDEHVEITLLEGR